MQRLPEIRGSSIELRPTDTYSVSRGLLSSVVREQLDDTETEIALDPGHRHWRHQVRDVVYDYSMADHGLIVVYRIGSETAVELVALLDIRATRRP